MLNKPSPTAAPKEARSPRAGPEVESRHRKARCLLNSRAFSRVAAVFFVLVALAHAWRAIQELPAQVGATAIPVWISWLAVAVTGSLAVLGFRARG